MKEKIRDNLDMVYQNMDNFNDYSLRFIDKKALRKLISIWRWYISHDYFKDTHPQPKGINSKPPIGWLDSQLQGLSVPLHRDIAECIAPKVESSIKTEHAARRIMNRLNMIYGYVSPEDMIADREAMHAQKVKKIKDHLRATKAREDRKPDKKAEVQKLVETDNARLSKKHLKDKDAQRKAEKTTEENKRAEVKKRAKRAAEKMRKAMRERRG